MVRTEDESNSPVGLSSAVLAWKDLAVATKHGGKVLLDGVSGEITGGLCAVMGPSGSGKSTLLNTLALRLDPRVKVSGEQRLNGRPYTSALLKQVAGYVMQDDLLNGQLTVEETLSYAAKLRCPPQMSANQRQARVEQAMMDMGLLHVRNVIVGDPLNKGISGGERKRLCVAIELITEPQLLFLDEPTSGLDSVTALGLIITLKQLSQGRGESYAVLDPVDAAEGGCLPALGLSKSPKGGKDTSNSSDAEQQDKEQHHRVPCTIVCTIHQPQAKIFQQFDHLFLLQSGSVVYQGTAAGALSHFASLGYPVPVHTNPADHFMDLITVRNTKTTTPACQPVAAEDMLPDPQELKGYYKNVEVDLYKGAHIQTKLREQVPWYKQFNVLLHRAMKENMRKREVLITQVVQTIVIAVLIGTVFLQIGNGQSSVVRRQPVLFFCVINQGVFASLTVINSFPSERLLVLRERAAGTYYASAYFMAKVVAELASQLLVPILFSCVVYWLVGLDANGGKFVVFTLFMILCNLAATSLALMVSTWCKSVDMATAVLPMALEVSRLFGGFFLSPANSPAYFRWLDALSYTKYTYIGISLNELQGLVLTCTDSQRLASGACPIENGEQTIEQLGLNRYSVQLCAGILLLFIVVCRFMAYLGMRFVKW